MNPCGDYVSGDWGIPSSNPYWFRVQYDNGGYEASFTCSVPGVYTGYKFGYKKGSSANANFATGWMTTKDGQAMAKTEQHGSTVIQPTTYFGCASSATCLSDYGIALRSIAQWGLCCSTQPALVRDDPPYLKMVNNYYSFKTCETSSACS